MKTCRQTLIECPRQFFAVEPIHAIRKLSGKSVKIYSWVAGSTYSLFYVFGPESLGGRGDLNTKVLAEVERTGRSYNEVAEEARAHLGFMHYFLTFISEHRLFSRPRARS